MKETIRTVSGMILGYLETMPNGDIKATNFSGIILGYYKKAYDYTTDFQGVIIARGNVASALVFNDR